MKEERKLYRKGIVVAILMIFAFILRMIYEDIDDAMMQSVMCLTRNTIHLSLLFLWEISLARRLVNKNVKRLMLAVGALLIFWLVDKIVKWDFTGSVTHPLVRYLWYGFYVGMLFVPTLGAFIINYLGKPENYAHPKKLNYLLIPPAIMLIAVFTNDLHQKVFVFYNGFINFDLDYSYDWLYYVVMSWFIVTGFYFVVMMVLKSRVPGSRKLQKMPVIVMACAALFWVGYSMRLYNCDLTVMDCLIIILLLESAIQSGLIPSNSRYQQLFTSTTLSLQIIDKDYKPRYVSAGSSPILERDLRRTEKGAVHLGNTLLNSASISAGRVVWQDDITEISELKARLQEALERLDEENVLLQAELELKEKRAKADEKNRLYDRIAREVEPQLIKADDMLSLIEDDPKKTRTVIAKVCVLGSYVKRRGNLMLLGEENVKLHARELEYCIRESLENLRLAGICTSMYCSCEGYLPLEHIIAVYDFYEDMVERLLDNITALMVNITCNNGKLHINIQMGCMEEIEDNVFADANVPYGEFTYDIIEEDVIINLTVLTGGDSI